jgi:tetratricopeptide (TPR) repeat protein
LYPTSLGWNKFPWQEAINHFARLLGAAHIKNRDAAKAELAKLKQLNDTLINQKDIYKARQVQVQINAGEAWILFDAGDKNKALQLMNLAADMEDSTEKNPVTPGEVIPARELLADMLLQMQQNENALLAYEAVLKKCPNRFNSLFGAGTAAEKTSDAKKAGLYFKQLSAIAGNTNSNRPELSVINTYLAKR